MDVFFTPRIGSFDVKQFLSFIQADGYEPLTVEAVTFSITDPDKIDEIVDKFIGNDDEAKHNGLVGIFTGGPFRPGQLLDMMEKQVRRRSIRKN